ncbi:phage head-tail connector protein [Bacillus spongiae]|uniref:Phage head-tail connector protein n=1 Tax=Bacillus spongiae TaxID=2683610 RepID=A0ABU8HK62_9BACI
MISELKLYLGVEGKDDLLSLLLDMTNDVIKSYCYCDDEDLEEIPTSTKLWIAATLYEKRKANGIASKTQGSRSITYTNVLSDDIKRQLNNFRRIRGVENV